MSECCQSRHDGERVPAYSTWAGIQHLLTLLTVADAWGVWIPIPGRQCLCAMDSRQLGTVTQPALIGACYHSLRCNAGRSPSCCRPFFDFVKSGAYLVMNLCLRVSLMALAALVLTGLAGCDREAGSPLGPMSTPAVAVMDAAAFAHADTGALDVYPCAHGEPATQHHYRYAATVSHAGDAAGAHDTTQSNAERHCRHAAANASRARTLW